MSRDNLKRWSIRISRNWMILLVVIKNWRFCIRMNKTRLKRSHCSRRPYLFFLLLKLEVSTLTHYAAGSSCFLFQTRPGPDEAVWVLAFVRGAFATKFVQSDSEKNGKDQQDHDHSADEKQFRQDHRKSIARCEREKWWPANWRHPVLSQSLAKQAGLLVTVVTGRN